MPQSETLTDNERLVVDLILGDLGCEHIPLSPYGTLPMIRPLRDDDMLPMRVGLLRKLARIALAVPPVDK